MKIYTKKGDTGETSLLGGMRVSKSHERIEAYGSVDELNSYIGLLRDLEVNKNRKDELKHIQDCLFTIGSLLAAEPGKELNYLPELQEKEVELLEQAMDTMDTQLPEMRNFLLPGGHSSVSFCHIARTVCRRSERAVIRLTAHEPVQQIITRYLNRLSDYLFMLSRMVAREVGAEEIPWTPRKA